MLLLPGKYLATKYLDWQIDREHPCAKFELALSLVILTTQ